MSSTGAKTRRGDARGQRVAVATTTVSPAARSIAELRRAARGCTACELYKRGTQTVFGAGDEHAQVMLVGEQPGNDEDLSGKPFVGPAGRVLDEALAAVGIDRRAIYVTNAVKHFKWEPRGKRRIHQKPRAGEVRACQPWLEAEIAAVKPRVIVCLGATAAQSLLGPAFRVTQHRGEIVASALGPRILVTIHPASILRIPDAAARHAARESFIADLQQLVGLVDASPPA